VALLVLAALPAGAAAATNPFDLQVEAGYPGTIRGGQWVPIVTTVRNSGPDFRGTLAVTAGANTAVPLGGQRVGGAGAAIAVPGKGFSGTPSAPTVYRTAVNLPAGSTKRFTTYVLANTGDVRSELLDTGDRLVAGAENRLRLGTAPSVAVISDTESTLDAFGEVHLPAGTARVEVVHFKPADLPPSGILLRAFDLVAIDDAATDGFTPSQKAALQDYVEMGGSLLVAGGASWRKSTAGIPADLLPVTITAGRTYGDLPGLRAALSAPLLGEPAVLAVAQPRDGVTVLSDDSLPLLVDGGRGDGHVLFTAMDFSIEPFRSWAGTRTLLRQVMVRALLSQPGANFGRNMPAFAPPQSSILDRGQRIAGVLANIPALDLPSFKLIGLLLLAYLVLVGPINYLVLRRLGRRDLAWLTIPVIVAVFAAGAYGFGLHAKGSDVLANRVQLIHLDEGWSRSYVESFAGIFVPHRGDYTVRVAGQPYVSALGGYAQSVFAGSRLLVQGRSPVDLRLTDVNAWSLRSFGSEDFMRLSGTVEPRIQVINGRITGTVTNRLPFALTDAVAIAGDSYQTFGQMAPGESVAVDLPADTAAQPGSGSVIYRIYPASGVPGPGIMQGVWGANVPTSGTTSAAQRETQRRSAVLQALYPYAGSGTTGVTPVFIGWASRSLDPLAVNGAPANVKDLDAFILPLRPRASVEGGPLAKGAAAARVVDLAGDRADMLQGSVVFLGSGGTATYEFALPGASWQEVRLQLSRTVHPYVFKMGITAPATIAQPGRGLAPPAAVINAVSAAVYNYQSGGWDSVAVTHTDSAEELRISALAAHLSPEGLLRVRLTGTSSSGTGVGSFSLTAEPGAAR